MVNAVTAAAHGPLAPPAGRNHRTATRLTQRDLTLPRPASDRPYPQVRSRASEAASGHSWAAAAAAAGRRSSTEAAGGAGAGRRRGRCCSFRVVELEGAFGAASSDPVSPPRTPPLGVLMSPCRHQ